MTEPTPPIVLTVRDVWPEAEAFEPAPGGWTFRVGAGYASVTSSGRVAVDPQGTRSDAQRFMHRSPVDGPGCTPAYVPHHDTGELVHPGSLYADKCAECTTGASCEDAGRCLFEG